MKVVLSFSWLSWKWNRVCGCLEKLEISDLEQIYVWITRNEISYPRISTTAQLELVLQSSIVFQGDCISFCTCNAPSPQLQVTAIPKILESNYGGLTPLSTTESIFRVIADNAQNKLIYYTRNSTQIEYMILSSWLCGNYVASDLRILSFFCEIFLWYR